MEVADAGRRQLEEGVELAAIEGAVLAGPLHLHEALRVRHHDVHVHAGPNVFLVVEVETRLTVDDADAHGGDAAADG